MGLRGLHKIKAGALQFTLLIGVLILLMLSSFVLLSYTHQRFRSQNSLLEETIKNASKGVYYALQRDRQFTEYDIVFKAPYFKEFEEVQVSATSWGIYTHVKSVASSKNYTFERNALIGSKGQKENRNALVLANTFSPLVLVGTSTIIGDVTLSEYGVNPGSIGSTYFIGNTLVDGKIEIDNSETLPQLQGHFIREIERLRKSLPNKSGNIIRYTGKPRYNSFKEETKWIIDSRELTLNDTITGNIIIHSDTKITVAPDAYLKDVILAAPEVIIQSGVEGNLQIFASKSIEIGNQVNLNFPSALVLVSEANYSTEADSETSISIKIGSESVVMGSLVFLGDQPNFNYQPEVFIDKGASIYGEIYCEQSLELKGNVYGSVLTRTFVSREFGSVYRNHIYDGTINSNILTSEFSGLHLDSTTKNVAKWVY
ncbi:hypothetical protein [Leeuwenhoekiella sp. H156]|uniref:hypothetical protein n=1 Tax=Leeuwenhoekiella sp. H156 TaxID=3450128 RepID=UPI003FA46050